MVIKDKTSELVIVMFVVVFKANDVRGKEISVFCNQGNLGSSFNVSNHQFCFVEDIIRTKGKIIANPYPN
jgi:hypothetical protein